MCPLKAVENSPPAHSSTYNCQWMKIVALHTFVCFTLNGPDLKFFAQFQGSLIGFECLQHTGVMRLLAHAVQPEDNEIWYMMSFVSSYKQCIPFVGLAVSSVQQQPMIDTHS